MLTTENAAFIISRSKMEQIMERSYTDGALPACLFLSLWMGNFSKMQGVFRRYVCISDVTS